MTTSKPNYLKFIAYLQVIGIIFVVFGHSFHEYDSSFGYNLLVYRMMHSVRMPLFIFVSGFLMIYTTLKRTSEPGFLSFTFKKIKRLMLPFIFLSTLTFLPRCMMNGIADDSLSPTLSGYINSLLFTDCLVIPFFWFLQMSFTLIVCCYGGIVVFRHHLNAYFAALAVISLYFAISYTGSDINFFSIGQTVRYAIYFVAGMCYCQYYRTIESIIGKLLVKPWFTLLFAAIWACLFFVTEGSQAMIICSLAGIVMSISLAKVIEARGWHFLDHLCGSTYMIFLLSWYFNVLSQQVLHHFTDFPWYIYSLISLITGVYLPYFIYRLLKKHPIRPLALLLGQNF
jgi:hypothetical protein